jgi:hypothetical protein
MTESAEKLDELLHDDVQRLGEGFADDESAAELYRALANTVWRKDGGPEGHISLSWKRAEVAVNALRLRHGGEPLELAQTGGEGDVSDRVAAELGRLGWSAEQLNTSRHDDRHVGESASAPPSEQGEQMAPGGDSGEWETVARRQADETLGRLPEDRR